MINHTSTKSAFRHGLGYSVKRLHQLIDQHVNDILRPYGLARSQWFLLVVLSEHKQLIQRQLQTNLQIEAATLTSLIDSLERKGLLTRTASSSDRRAKYVQLTTAGKLLWKQLPNPIKVTRESMFKDISEAEENIAREIIDKAIHNLEKER